MSILEHYWYLIFAVAAGLFAIWMVLFRSRKGDAGTSRGMSWLFFGPFGPAVDRYLNNRGGLTRRELIGWGIVAVIMVLAILFAPGGRGT